ncbi:hypothetical protein [Oceanicoccus sp. KOV_DT_Chl]|uniref:hypothetical protein n=1 Tax=Oceanicoccus sp. KOV_DT_Chl TaxID=1904639 RepID=UPI000C7AF72E|nr:hypothetical protein [Oceanicoccus sp. KOV_DT_Chl]
MVNKKNISVRLLESDLRRIKEVSGKLGIKDSDLFRYAVKMTLTQLMPLMRQDIKGIDFLLAVLDAGSDLLRYFEFDSHILDRIVNEGVAADNRVAMMDIELVCMASMNERYLITQLRERGEDIADDDILSSLKSYLKKQYCVFREEENSVYA